MTSPQDRCPKPPPRAEWPVSRRAAPAALTGSGLLGSAPTASAAETPLVTASPAKPERSPR
ncbi:hypothetical protein [Streptomyces sp. NBC_00145]|uniref:hypothetical protein n=1 Tax=Streptomyces sp. NBC_00145 TaxID=2975666 RepID=UPI002E198594